MTEEETTLRMPCSLRDRLKVVAAIEKCSMKDWIEKRVADAEQHHKKHS